MTGNVQTPNPLARLRRLPKQELKGLEAHTGERPYRSSGLLAVGCWLLGDVLYLLLSSSTSFYLLSFNRRPRPCMGGESFSVFSVQSVPKRQPATRRRKC